MQSESDGRSRTHTSKRPAPSTRVGIINYGVGNIRSLRNAFAAIGAVPAVLSDPHDLPKVDRVVLPGVGAFVGAMARLRDQGWVEALQRVVLEQGKPLLGVCLGMQLLADRSTEHGGGKGLGWISGTVRRLSELGCEGRLPHIGWNDVTPVSRTGLYAHDEAPHDYYFVHSYAFVPEDATAVVTGHSSYGCDFVASVQKDRIFATQYHPEKSHGGGLAVLRNFASVD